MATRRKDTTAVSSNQFPTPIEHPIAAPKTSLLTWDQLPHWQRDNHYILTSYRPASYSVPRSLFSSFSLHNETVNIQTHLFGTLLFLCLPLYLAPLSRTITSHTTPFLPLLPFFAGSVICLAASTTFHAVSNVSPHVQRIGNQIDYLGIIALITGSFVPSVMFGFHCFPTLQRTYTRMILVLGVLTSIVTINPGFRTPKWRPVRAAMFVGMGMSAVFPVIHGISMWGVEVMEDRIALRWLVSQGLLYTIGAALYAARVPERWYPGRFDVVGSSHQIFHVLVVTAAVVHLIGLLKAADRVRVTGECKM